MRHPAQPPCPTDFYPGSLPRAMLERRATACGRQTLIQFRTSFSGSQYSAHVLRHHKNSSDLQHAPVTAANFGSDELLGGGRQPRSAGFDGTVTRVLTRGEPVAPPTGRADDFSWPPRGVNIDTNLPEAPPAPALPASDAADKQAGSKQQQRPDTQAAARAPAQRRPTAAGSSPSASPSSLAYSGDGSVPRVSPERGCAMAICGNPNIACNCASHPGYGLRESHRIDRGQRVRHTRPVVALVLTYPQPPCRRAEG